jgi:hypothetical protein
MGLAAATFLAARQFLADSVEKVPSLKSLQICQNTIDVFD